jgi:hypothetical protein
VGGTHKTDGKGHFCPAKAAPKNQAGPGAQGPGPAFLV